MDANIKLNADQIETLIELRCVKYSHYFTGKNFKNNEGWKLITKELEIEEEKFKIVKKKWENLLQKYKALKKPPSGVSTEDGADLPTKWPYYELIDKYWAEKHIMRPTCLVASMPSTSNSNVLAESSSGSITATPSTSSQSATEYFGGRSEFFAETSTPRKRKSDLLDYLKKRDRKILQQNKMMIKLMKRSLAQDGIDVSEASNSSEDE